MAEIHPFRGVHYNQLLIKDLSTVICSPYDVITPQLQQELYHRNQYNFVRLEYGRELPQDAATDNKYIRSANTLEQWLEQGILEVDKLPAIYLHDQYFTYQGREYKRRGMITRMKLEEWDRGIVRPHEGTLGEPKSDRLNLLRELRASTSPILALFEDQRQQVASALVIQERKSNPVISLSGYDGERHYIWAVTEPQAINQICNSLARQSIYIADGHHRYESALAYRHEQMTYSPLGQKDEASNFVMMTLVDFSDPGLVVLPHHRLVRGISKPALSGFMNNLKSFFDIEELPLGVPNIWQKVDNLPKGLNEVRLFLFGLEGRLLLLRLRDFAVVSQMMPYFHSELYKRLDISVTDHIILENLLGLSSDGEEVKIAYSHDKQDAINRVIDQEYQLAFLLSPVKIEVVKAIADAKDRLSRKSTYFYPKLPAGLVFHRLA